MNRRSLLKSLLVGAGALAVPGAASAAVRGTAVRTAAQAVGVSGATVLQLARVWISPGSDISGFDDTHVVFDDGSVELLLWPGDVARLQATGLRYEITVADVMAHDAAADAAAPGRPALSVLKPQPGERTAYRRLPDYDTDMAALVARFPTKARLFTLPERTLEGRQVVGIEIGHDVARKDGRPVFYQDGCHHAREWPAAEMCIMWAYDLLENDGKDARITALMANARHVIIPIVNRDGFQHSRESLVELSNTGGLPPGGLEAYWRKNKHSYTELLYPAGGVESHGNADAHGIDNNRNYGYRWGGNGSSADKTVQDSRGTAPFSEPETRNIAWALGRWQCTAANTNHTAGNLILRAWGDTQANSPDETLMKTLGDAMGKITGYKSQKSIQLYVTTGTCSDFMYGALGSISYTFEHSGGGFHPDYMSTVPAMYAKVRPAFLLLAEAAADPALHSIVRGRLVDGSGAPVTGEVFIRKSMQLSLVPGNPTGQATTSYAIQNFPVETGPDGTFELHTNPSTQPFLYYEGKEETFEIVAKAGSATGTSTILALRGQTHDLGNITVR